MRKFLIASVLLLISIVSQGQSTYQRIDNFIIKENLTSNGKVAIIAVDSSEIAQDYIHY
jgi:archaellum biogenesis ATPase FlaH